MRRILAGFLATILFVATIAPSVAFAKFKGYGEDGQEHSGINYEDMVFAGYDGKELRKIIDDMNTKMKDAKNGEAIVSDYEKIIVEFDIFATQYALNNVRYYSNPLIEEYAEINLEMSSLWTELADATLIAIREALKSPCADALKKHINDEELVEDYLDYEDMTERQHELVTIGNELVQEYDKSQSTEYSVEYNGETWTKSEAEAAYAAGEIDDVAYSQINLLASQARNEVEAGIYAKLVNVKNEQARIDGYDNYAEMAYEDVYNRDYTTDDAKNLYAYTKKYLVPMEGKLYECFYSEAILVVDKMFGGYLMEDEALVDLVEPYVGEVHKGLTEAYTYLKDNHTYEMDYLDTKMGVGYTTSLYQYGCPFIFNCPSGSYYDIETLIHEFGHYNNAYHNDVNCLLDPTNMDVAEIHSQGLEMLMFEYFNEIYGEDTANAVRFATLYNMLNSVIEGCLYDEFQNEVYSYPGEITAAECNRIFRRLSTEYGYNYGNDLDEAYDWVNVSHTFQSPMYYISYATSALAAFDIFALAQKNRKDAVDLYMTLTTYGLDTPFCELLDTVGLPDIFEEKTIKNIANELDSYSTGLYATGSAMKLGVKVLVGFAIAFVVIVAIIVVVIVLVVKKNKKKRLAAAAAAEAAAVTVNDAVGSEIAESADDGEEAGEAVNEEADNGNSEN
ncbi:MAG: hypothetical protein K6F63_04545 [Lachnospiraceae bacterium]|nr:hypothetical protein [Lachnospiraceae bacterium]